MKKIFIANLRLLAQFTREPLLEDLNAAIAHAISLRETIQKQFGTVRSLADGVLFEFGPTRQQDLALRNRIRRWQPQLRTFFVLRNTLIKYRLQLPGFELPETVRQAQQEFDEQLARRLESIADGLEGHAPGADELEHSFERLEQAARDRETFLSLSQTSKDLIISLEPRSSGSP
jgi:multidrug resistance protein MdtO